MNTEWQVEILDNMQRVKDWLLEEDGDGGARIYRGQLACFDELIPTLDRGVPRVIDQDQRLDQEGVVLHKFRERANSLLGNIERKFIRGRRKILCIQDEKSIPALMVMQHYGAPTRLLDWTLSRPIAAYFACIEESKHGGAVWWVDQEAIVDYVDSRWESLGFNRLTDEPGSEVDLDSGMFQEHDKALVSIVHTPIAFPRLEAQRGVFTIGTVLGAPHDQVLAQQVAASRRGRVVIASSLRQQVVALLDRLGITAVSLQHAGADHIGRSISEEFRAKFHQAHGDC